MEISAIFRPQAMTRLRRNLRRWYERHGRHLPWRAAGDPYRVWVSEIMLQQTTVAAVVPYYERFLARFPNVQSLAAAEEQDVLRLWEGLGYYSRARNLHKSARRLVRECEAVFPQDVPSLMSLPGIGRYTAGAIASFAFDIRAPILEANTLRLYCRLLGYDGDPRATDGQRILWEFAEHLLPRRRAGEFNQALMDLGATVCVPTEPGCRRCPLRTCCVAFRKGNQDIVPRQSAPIPVAELSETTVAVRKRGAYLLRQRGESERWGGLWDFPRFALEPGVTSAEREPGERLSPAQSRQIAEQLEQLTGIRIQAAVELATLKHSVTRYRITLHCLHAEYASGRLHRSAPAKRWVRPEEFARYPLSVTGRKLASRLLDGVESRNSTVNGSERRATRG